MLDKEFLDMLACPVDRSAVTLDGDRFVCLQCGRRYPIRDGIPVLLAEEAEADAHPAASAPPARAPDRKPG